MSLLSCSTVNKKVVSAVWERELETEIKALGYRNWLVIADASFPFLSRSGVRTVIAPVETPEIIDSIISSMDRTQHVEPRFYTSRELRFLNNRLAPGVEEFKFDLEKAIRGYETRELDHKVLLKVIENTKEEYVVLVVKSETTIPYSTVFIELDSGYWDGQSENVLRKFITEEKLKEKSS